METTEFDTLIKQLSPALRKHVQRITDPAEKSDAIWKWVNDESNAHYVRDLAVKHLHSLRSTRERNTVRNIERASTHIVAESQPSARYELPTYTEEQMAEWERKWDEAQRNRAAQARAQRERFRKEVADANPGIDCSELTDAQFELAHLGFPVSDFYVGAERIEQRESFRVRPDFSWRDEYGFKGKRNAAVEAVTRADDIEFGTFRRVHKAMEEYRDHLKAEWTSELLAQTFVVDGVAVTWADATVEQHRARANELSEHAIGTLQTAALHERAVSDLSAAHVNRLADLQLVAA